MQSSWTTSSQTATSTLATSTLSNQTSPKLTFATNLPWKLWKKTAKSKCTGTWTMSTSSLWLNPTSPSSRTVASATWSQKQAKKSPRLMSRSSTIWRELLLSHSSLIILSICPISVSNKVRSRLGLCFYSLLKYSKLMKITRRSNKRTKCTIKTRIPTSVSYVPK